MNFKLLPSEGVHLDLKDVIPYFPSDYRVLYGRNGDVPSIPLNNGFSLKINGNTVFRFKIIDDKGKVHEISATYIVDRIPSLPVVSVIVEPHLFFDSINGIYEKGCCADTVNPYKGANFWKDIELSVFVSFIEKDTLVGFNQKAGVKIFGGFSKAMPQKSFAFYARKKYGDNKFKYPLFDDLPFKKYKNFILRNAGGDMHGAHIRDVLASQLIKNTGLSHQAYKPVAVYINGNYWGKYNLREKINEHFIANHYGFHKDSLIIMRHRDDHQHGPPKYYRKFIAKLPSLDLNDGKDLNYVQAQMDIDNYLLYNISEIYTANSDAGGNIRYFKALNDTAKWRWIFYDLDLTFNINGKRDHLINSVNDFTVLKNETWPNPPWSTLIIRKLLENDSLKYRYINRFCDLLNTHFLPEKALKTATQLKNELADEIPFHLKRWRVSTKRYEQSWEDIYHFIENRPGVLYKYLMQRFELTDSLIVNININNGGKLVFNTLEIDSNFTGKYFKDVPFSIKALPDFDHLFKGWNFTKDTSQQLYFTYRDLDTLKISPIFEIKPKSIFNGKVFISEVDGHQALKMGDWVELFNNSNDTISLEGWMLKDNDDEHLFSLPSNAYILPKGFVILAQNMEEFKLKFVDTSLVYGDFSFGLKSNKDKVRLYDADGLLIDFLDLSNLQFLEKEGTNFVRISYATDGVFSTNEWILEEGSPFMHSNQYKRNVAISKRNRLIKNIFLFVGIAMLSIFLIIFSIHLYHYRKQKNLSN